MIHIGISGPIASGKSYLAEHLKYIIDTYEYTAVIIPFATGIREIVALEYEQYRKQLIQRKLFEWGYAYEISARAADDIHNAMIAYPSEPNVKNRRLLQIIGGEIGRDTIDKDIWITRVHQLIHRYEPMPDFVISDDLRHDNEALAVDVHIGIDAAGDLYQQRTSQFDSTYMFSDHPSERSLTLQPMFTVPVGFDNVHTLYHTLDYIRRLRV